MIQFLLFSVYHKLFDKTIYFIKIKDKTKYVYDDIF